MAKFELVRLYHAENGMWVASLYNAEEGYFKEQRFLWYSKKEVIAKLRRDFHVKVSREFCTGKTGRFGYKTDFWNTVMA